MRSQEDVKKDLEEADKQLHAWAKKREELADELDVVQTASFSPELVEKARMLGINPNNYESEDGIEEAIKIVTKTNKENQ